MTGARRAVAALGCALLGVPLLGARGEPAPPAAPALPPAAVLARYAAALAALRVPATQSFDYTVEQLGLRDIEQTHRVYLSGRRERDETTVVDGYTLRRPSVRVMGDKTDRYAIALVAPRPAAYAFSYLGAERRGSHYLYAFKTTPLGTRAFAVSGVQIDGTHFLPARIRFEIAGAGTHGSGELAYGPSDGYWMVRDARVEAHLADGSTAREHIAWSGYTFPAALPASTFERSRAPALEPPSLPLATPPGAGAAEP